MYCKECLITIKFIETTHIYIYDLICSRFSAVFLSLDMKVISYLLKLVFVECRYQVNTDKHAFT